jgi:hypothetical protein
MSGASHGVAKRQPTALFEHFDQGAQALGGHEHLKLSSSTCEVRITDHAHSKGDRKTHGEERSPAHCADKECSFEADLARVTPRREGCDDGASADELSRAHSQRAELSYQFAPVLS